MKSLSYTLVVLFGALSFANADAAKDLAATATQDPAVEEVVVVDGENTPAATEGTSESAPK